MRHLKPTVAAVLLVLFSVAPVATAAGGSGEYSKRVLGCWLGSRKFSVFHADGTWGVKRHEDAPEVIDGRHWRIKGKTLFLTYPDDHGPTTAALTIIALTEHQMIVESDGHREQYTRHSADCQPEALPADSANGCR